MRAVYSWPWGLPCPAQMQEGVSFPGMSSVLPESGLALRSLAGPGCRGKQSDAQKTKQSGFNPPVAQSSVAVLMLTGYILHFK